MLISTEKDNSMLSIIESLACGCPILSNTVPFLESFINENNLGIAKDNWSCDELNDICYHQNEYINNCRKIRKNLSYEYKVNQFIEEWKLL